MNFRLITVITLTTFIGRSAGAEEKTRYGYSTWLELGITLDTQFYGHRMQVSIQCDLEDPNTAPAKNPLWKDGFLTRVIQNTPVKWPLIREFTVRYDGEKIDVPSRFWAIILQPDLRSIQGVKHDGKPFEIIFESSKNFGEKALKHVFEFDLKSKRFLRSNWRRNDPFDIYDPSHVKINVMEN